MVTVKGSLPRRAAGVKVGESVGDNAAVFGKQRHPSPQLLQLAKSSLFRAVPRKFLFGLWAGRAAVFVDELRAGGFDQEVHGGSRGVVVVALFRLVVAGSQPARGLGVALIHVGFPHRPAVVAGLNGAGVAVCSRILPLSDGAGEAADLCGLVGVFALGHGHHPFRCLASTATCS